MCSRGSQRQCQREGTFNHSLILPHPSTFTLVSATVQQTPGWLMHKLLGDSPASTFHLTRSAGVVMHSVSSSSYRSGNQIQQALLPTKPSPQSSGGRFKRWGLVNSLKVLYSISLKGRVGPASSSSLVFSGLPCFSLPLVVCSVTGLKESGPNPIS